MNSSTALKIVHSEASCGWGGQEIRILEEARGLIARGHEVSLLCPVESRIYEEAPRFGVAATALPIARKRLPGLLAMRRWLAEYRPDVLNTHSSTDSWLAGLACLTLGHPPAIVRTRHISAPIAVNASSRWLYGRSAQHVVTTGEALRQKLLSDLGLPANRVTSVPTGIDPARFARGDRSTARQALGLDVDRKYIGIVATLRSWKGHSYLLEAFAQLKPVDWTLIIVGEGPQLENIRTRITELGLDNQVLMVGQRTDPEAWMRALDIFCLPSYANEGVPQSIMQAMLIGLPIVTTPVGAILEAVSDGSTALVVEPRSTPALADALARLIDNHELAKKLSAAAYERATALFTLDRMLDKMERIFISVAEQRR